MYSSPSSCHSDPPLPHHEMPRTLAGRAVLTQHQWENQLPAPASQQPHVPKVPWEWHERDTAAKKRYGLVIKRNSCFSVSKCSKKDQTKAGT